MNLAAQEQALFDLLFNSNLRTMFGRDRAAALRGYALSPDQLRDFESIRQDALEFDAGLRRAILLAAIAKSLPLTFAGLSASPDGVARLQEVLDASLVRAAPADRPVQYADRLREEWDLWPFASRQEQASMQAILDAEWGMACTAASRRSLALSDLPAETPLPPLPSGWMRLPVALAPFVSAGVLPQSWEVLRQAWCPGDPAGLWRALQSTPLPLAQRQALLARPQPRLLVARAVVAVPSDCDPVIEHHTAELSEGFASLFQHVSGRYSVGFMLAGLRDAGAATELLESVEAGFRQLLEAGMLVLAGGSASGIYEKG